MAKHTKKPYPVSADLKDADEFLANLESYFAKKNESTDKLIGMVDKILSDVKKNSVTLNENQLSAQECATIFKG